MKARDVVCFVLLALVTEAYSSEPTDKAVDLRPHLSPVKNRADRNTCSAFAATALMEFLIHKDTGQEIDLSESLAY